MRRQFIAELIESQPKARILYKSQVTIEDGKDIARTQDLVRIFQHLLPNKSSVRDNIAKVRLSYCS